MFLGLGLPAFVVVFGSSPACCSPLTPNKALLLMIPQFLGQAAMLVPFALLFRWKYDRLSAAMRLRVAGAMPGPSLGWDWWLRSVYWWRLWLCDSGTAAPDAGSDERSDFGAVGSRFRDLDWSRVEEIFFAASCSLSRPVLGPIAGILIGAVRSRCFTVRSMHGRGGMCC